MTALNISENDNMLQRAPGTDTLQRVPADITPTERLLPVIIAVVLSIVIVR